MVAAQGCLPDALPQPDAVFLRPLDDEFRRLIPPPATAEREGLEQLLLRDGCRDALVVWKGHDVLLDGYTRHSICTEHDLPFRVVEMDFPDRQAARRAKFFARASRPWGWAWTVVGMTSRPESGRGASTERTT